MTHLCKISHSIDFVFFAVGRNYVFLLMPLKIKIHPIKKYQLNIFLLFSTLKKYRMQKIITKVLLCHKKEYWAVNKTKWTIDQSPVRSTIDVSKGPKTGVGKGCYAAKDGNELSLNRNCPNPLLLCADLVVSCQRLRGIWVLGVPAPPYKSLVYTLLVGPCLHVHYANR